MAHKKGGSSRAHQAHHTIGKRRGIKKYGGARVKTGQILVRQVGNKWRPGKNVGQSRNFTLFALKNGIVKFHHRRIEVEEINEQ